MLDPLLQCIRLTDFACMEKEIEFKILLWRITSTLSQFFTKGHFPLKLFFNESPLNNAIFVNLQQIMGDMRTVILAYRIIYTDAFIYKSVKAKECIVRMYTYLRVMHYDRRANNLKQTHCVKGKGKSRYKIEAKHMWYPHAVYSS